ncbi:MAG TPA: hypothetical protein VML55_18240 [Planctomycetaceae bacterium]|nr:hypothetical protein [Planctomycetaceae bacterium]
MASADDRRLLDLAAEPAGELFPMLQRATAFRPLLVLLAVLPGLYALTQRSFTETDAWWSLASLELAVGASPEPHEAGSTVETADLAAPWRPPLSVWLTALVMRVFGPGQDVATALAAYLATIVLVVLAYHLFGRLGDARLGFWVAVFIAFHGPVLAQAQTPVPVSLGVVLAMGAVWGFHVHMRTATAPVSVPLLLGGVSLGLCLLAAGPLALGVAVLLVGCAVVAPARRPAARVVPHPALIRRRSWPAAVPLGVLLLTAFAVGGWWPLMAAWDGGSSSVEGAARRSLPGVSTWLTFGRHTADAAPTEGGGMLTFWADAYDQLREACGALAGLALLGLWRAARVGFAPDAGLRSKGSGGPPAPWLRTLVVWTALALLALTAVVRAVPDSSQALALWRGFLIVPMVGLASFAADEIARRRIGVPGAVAAGIASLAVTVELAAWRRLIGPSSEPGLLIPVLLAAAPLFVAIVWRLCRGSDDRQQAALTVVIVAHLAANAVLGLAAAHRQTEDDRALAGFRRELSLAGQAAGTEGGELADGVAANVAAVATWTFISDVELPLPVRYVLRSQWPEATPWPPASRGRVETWDAALAGVLSRGITRERASVVVEWSSRETQPANIQVPGLQVVPAGRPQFYRDRPLRAFLVTPDAP